MKYLLFILMIINYSCRALQKRSYVMIDSTIIQKDTSGLHVDSLNKDTLRYKNSYTHMNVQRPYKKHEVTIWTVVISSLAIIIIILLKK